MRRAPKLDGNHQQIVKALEKIGATVQSLAHMGHGVPDLLVGYHGVNLLLEVKDGSKPPSKRQLTQDEVNWHTRWAGTIRTVHSEEEAQLAVIRHCCPAQPCAPINESS